ncbi:MAG: SAM-dependent methyltransferase [Pseudomonadota bacterium]
MANGDLKDRLRHRIDRDGPITVADYMSICLTDPEAGYYTTTQAIGQKGDFVTAPEVSQVFGELIGLFFADYWQRSGQPPAIRLIELGPGRGTLMADLLRAARSVPVFFESLTVDLVEISPILRSAQADRLAASRRSPTWFDCLEDIPNDRPQFIIANEFFDALPITQIEHTETGWRERLVTYQAGTQDFAFAHAEHVTPAPDGQESAPIGSIMEQCAAARTVMAEICQRIGDHGGVALAIDYGYEGPAIGDTLQAVKAHQYANPLTDPGNADLTAHVDFTPLEQAATDQDTVPWGVIPQGRFLRSLGLEQRLQSLSHGKPDDIVRTLRGGAERLVGPGQMGRLFKVLAVTERTGPPPAGFESADTQPGNPIA